MELTRSPRKTFLCEIGLCFAMLSNQPHLVSTKIRKFLFFKAIASGCEAVKKSSKLRKLNVFLDESEVLRAGTRLLNAETLEYNMKFPIVLPKSEVIVSDLVRFTHEALAHAGVEQVRHTLREKFHIVSDGMLVRSVVKGCVECQRRFKKPAEQKMAPLPTERVEVGNSFEITGVDVFGPYVVKHKGRSTNKRWVALFTCMKTRLVHL